MIEVAFMVFQICRFLIVVLAGFQMLDVRVGLCYLGSLAWIPITNLFESFAICL